MKSRILIPALFLSMFFSVQSGFAQMKKIGTVRNLFTKEENIDIEQAKYNIDMVMENPETQNVAAAWGWRGVIYSHIAASPDDPICVALNADKKAARIAGESLIKFYDYSESEQKKFEALTYADNYLPSCIVACYNMGVGLAYDKGNFEEVKTYMEIVDALLVFDKEEKAIANSVSREKAILTIWRSAYGDSLVDKEIIYLDKLANIPTYYNSDVFVRLSEIYAGRKEYDKALAYLDKGKEKIPQKASEFLDQQINIEIERGNTKALLDKFNEAIEKNPENAIYYFSRGVVYHQLKETEVKEQEQAFRNTGKSMPSKYFYSQGLADYAKAIELDPGYFDAKNNEAGLLKDSADFIYRTKNKYTGAEYDKHFAMAINLYKEVLVKLEWLRESGIKKDQDLVDLLEIMKQVSAKTGMEEKRAKYNQMYLDEKKKLEAKLNGSN